MRHQIMYCGGFDRNIHSLASDTSAYRDAEGNVRAIAAPSKTVNGIVFGYMEKQDKQFVAVRADDVVFMKPVPLDPRRHTDGKGFGPNGTIFGDAAAQQLLEDAIRLNPAYAEPIRLLMRRVGPVPTSTT